MPIKTNGPVTKGTRQNLITGLRTKPMNAAAVDAALNQAQDFAQKLVDTYEAQIAAGEVGPDGSATASENDILADRAPTALLYGRVQSGKTAAMNLTAALCIDNGFRVVVVLTANNVALVEQTANRFRALDGPRVFSTATDDQYEWEGQEEDVADGIGDDGLVIVCAKDTTHLQVIARFLSRVEAPAYPAIIFDDEADAATPDTTLASRSSGRRNAPSRPSTTFRRVVENPMPIDEERAIRAVLPHSIYVQVTATPFILLLQRDESPIRPTITFLLEPGDGYSGGERFFARFDVRADRPDAPIVLVPDHEGQTISRGRRVPPGLAASINFFLVAAAARAAAVGSWPSTGFSHLSHTSSLIDQHTLVAGHIGRHINELSRLMRREPEQAVQALGEAYAELRRTVNNPPALNELTIAIYEALKQRTQRRVHHVTARALTFLWVGTFWAAA